MVDFGYPTTAQMIYLFVGGMSIATIAFGLGMILHFFKYFFSTND